MNSVEVAAIRTAANVADFPRVVKLASEAKGASRSLLKAVLIAITGAADNSTGCMYVSAATISGRIGRDRRAVERAFRYLEHLGWIVFVGHRRVGSKVVREYVIAVGALQAEGAREEGAREEGAQAPFTPERKVPGDQRKVPGDREEGAPGAPQSPKEISLIELPRERAAGAALSAGSKTGTGEAERPLGSEAKPTKVHDKQVSGKIEGSMGAAFPGYYYPLKFGITPDGPEVFAWVDKHIEDKCLCVDDVWADCRRCCAERYLNPLPWEVTQHEKDENYRFPMLFVCDLADEHELEALLS